MSADDFQEQVWTWSVTCFGLEVASNKPRRFLRFFEEATELAQSGGMTSVEAHQMVDLIFSRQVGELRQEIGGVMTTLMCLCEAHSESANLCGQNELARCWENIEKIRERQKTKPVESVERGTRSEREKDPP